MKSVLPLLVFFLALSSPALAQRRRSAVRVQLSDGRPLTVVINGRNYDRKSPFITIGDLPRGKHRVEVYAMRGRRLQNPELVYRGRVRTDEGTTTFMTVDVTRHSARIQVREGLSPWQEDNDDRYQSRRDDDEDNFSRGSTGSSRAAWFSDADLEDLRQRTGERTGDADKLKLIRSAIAGRAYSTAQVRAMAGMLSFESTKLDFAKQAYNGVSDPKDYWKLEDIFTFDASKKELTEYMAQRR